MKRIEVLRGMKQFLDSKGYSTCCELLIPQQDYFNIPINKNRSIFIVDVPTDFENDIREFLEFNGLLQVEYRYYPELSALEKSDLIVGNEFNSQYNWRGRVLKFQDDFDLNTAGDTFFKVFLKSYFRLILTLVNGEYFGRHDVAPSFYTPSYSIAGHPDFLGPVENLVSFVSRARGNEFGPVDPYFDFIKVFVSNGKGQKYHQLKLSGHDEIDIRSVFAVIDSQNVAAANSWLYDLIDHSWKR